MVQGLESGLRVQGLGCYSPAPGPAQSAHRCCSCLSPAAPPKPQPPILRLSQSPITINLSNYVLPHCTSYYPASSLLLAVPALQRHVGCLSGAGQLPAASRPPRGPPFPNSIICNKVLPAMHKQPDTHGCCWLVTRPVVFICSSSNT